jgi:hypothetical protein
MHPALPLSAFALLALAGPQDPARPAPPPAAAPAAPAKIDPSALQQLQWLCGTWVLENGKETIEEHWRPLQGSTILGTSHTFTAAKTRFFEHLRIAARDGTIAYVAMPGGQPATVFPISKLEQHAVEFTNAQHDYPQRIRYEKTEAGVTATISLADGGKAQRFVFRKRD